MTGSADLLIAGRRAIQAGRPAEAERLCRQALESDPESHEGWFLLGLTHHFRGQLDEAAKAYSNAVGIRPEYPEALINLGAALQDLGRSAEAVANLQRALALRPDVADIHFNLGNALNSLGRFAEASDSYGRAIQLRPDLGDAHNNRGNVLRELGRFDEAAASFQSALALRPDMPEVHFNLGNVLRELKRLDEAAACFQLALRLRPNFTEAEFSLANTLRDFNRLDDAANSYVKVLLQRPDHLRACNGLGNVLRNLGRLDDAVNCFRRAVELQPDLPEAHYNLGNALREWGRHDEAVKRYAEALRLRPDYTEALVNLCNTLQELGRPGLAVERLAEVIERRPDFAEAHNSLGNALRDLGRLDEALACFRQALELRPDHVAAHDNLLLTLHYQPYVTPNTLAAEHAEYNLRHASPLRSTWRPHNNDRDPERPLRIGFVSADLARHPVGFLLIRGAESLARRPGAFAYYSDRRAPPDDMTLRFRKAATLWRETAGDSDEQLAERIRADSIDILIDLAGHTGGNRLLTFARRPAPVQATWLGYVGTTGLEAIDYLIADIHQVPIASEAHHRERVLRLPGGYATYDPEPGLPEPGTLPASTSGYVTFGCFNNPAKLTAETLDAFAEVLARVPRSRIVLKYRGLDDPALGTRILDAFAAKGIERVRVQFRGGTARAEHLAAYRAIDIALDSFPYSGGVTTCDALWMGVPVITLPGATFASRHGLTHLSSVGLAEFAAQDVASYVSLATGLAQEPDRLAALRIELRSRMERSRLCDGERLAEELLAALRLAWREAMAVER